MLFRVRMVEWLASPSEIQWSWFDSVESKQNFFDFQVSAVLATTELREARGFATSLVKSNLAIDIAAHKPDN